jgi:hypothetical protein
MDLYLFLEYYGGLIFLIVFVGLVLGFALWMRKRNMRHFDRGLAKSHENQEKMITFLQEISRKLDK